MGFTIRKKILKGRSMGRKKIIIIRKKGEHYYRIPRKIEKDEEVNRIRSTTDEAITMILETTDDHNDLPCLPSDLVLYTIISRLPVKSLLRFRCVSKLWYNTIDHDPHFHSAHSIQSRKNPILMFQFFNMCDSVLLKKYRYYYLEQKDDILMISNNNEDGGVKLSSLASFSVYNPRISILNATIGCCNGLVCICVVSREGCMIRIFNPSRRQVLNIDPPIKVDFESIKGYGFGFDSLTNEYKVVCIIGKDLEYCCLVYTLGSNNSWRKVTGPGPCVLNSKFCSKSAISCEGALYFKIANEPFDLLSFDLHDEKFQFIYIPVSGTTRPQLWFHYLEFQGCLCFTSLEKFDEKNYKVHVIILMDKIRQGWIKDSFLVPSPCDRSARIMCFSNRFLLYWFSGNRFLFYDIHTKVPNVVKFPNGHFSKKKHLNTLRKAEESINYNLYHHVPSLVCLRNLCSGDSFLNLEE